MIDSIIIFSKSPIGEILIRVICVLFIGLGLKYFLMKIADLFELLSRSKKAKEAIDILSNIASNIGTVGVSFFVCALYRKKGQSDFLVYGEAVIYGLGAIGLYYFFVSGKFKSIWLAIKNGKGKK